MAGNGRNAMPLCKCMLYHSASRRTRRSNNRYLHVATPLALITMIRIASAIQLLDTLVIINEHLLGSARRRVYSQRNDVAMNVRLDFFFFGPGRHCFLNQMGRSAVSSPFVIRMVLPSWSARRSRAWLGPPSIRRTATCHSSTRLRQSRRIGSRSRRSFCLPFPRCKGATGRPPPHGVMI
jgi:hypothetical protein